MHIHFFIYPPLPMFKFLKFTKVKDTLPLIFLRPLSTPFALFLPLYEAVL